MYCYIKKHIKNNFNNEDKAIKMTEVQPLVKEDKERSKKIKAEKKRIEQLEKGIHEANKEYEKYKDDLKNIKLAKENGKELTDEQKDILYKDAARTELLKETDISTIIMRY